MGKRNPFTQRLRKKTEPLNPYVTRQLEIYRTPQQSTGIIALWLLIQRFFKRRIQQPLIALIGLLLGFGFIYWAIGMSSDGPIRQKSLAWAKRFSLDSPIHQVQALGRMIQQNAEYTVLIDAMERTRLMVEAYPVEGRNYPDNLDQLYERAKAEGYWALHRNPFTKSRQREGIIRDYSDYGFATDKVDFAGMILYQQMGAYDYRIYGCDEKGELLKQGDEILFLSRP